MPLTPNVQFTGNVGSSYDATSGGLTGGGDIFAEVPDGSEILYAAVYATTFTSEQTVGVTLTSGSDALVIDDFVSLGTNNASSTLTAYRADVTDFVSEVIGDGDGLPFTFTASDLVGFDIDGFALTVIYDNPMEDEGTISILDGFSASSGDDFSLVFDQPIADPSNPAFVAEMSLGIGFGFQPSLQSSQITINGELLTTSAGGYDDGANGNGGLITIGGLGDSTDNPDPNAGSEVDSEFDDELYDLSSFIDAGDTSISVETLNPSGDDNIFFASFLTNPPTTVVSIAPSGVADDYGTAFETVLTIDAANGVLANDSDDGTVDAATLETGVDAADGDLTFNDDGSFSFAPADGFSGDATFTYRAQDNDGLSSFPTTVTITVEDPVVAPPPLTEPNAMEDSYSTPFETALDVAAADGVLANDSDDKPGLAAFLVDDVDPAEGTLALDEFGGIMFTPAAGFSGDASFTYQAVDSDGLLSAVTEVTITVEDQVVAPPPPTAPPSGDGTVTGFVYKDLDNNNVFNLNPDFRLSGQTVSLLDDAGHVIDSAVTNRFGKFTFDDVASGDYQLDFDLEDRFQFAEADQGTIEGRDSDVTGDDGTTDVFSVDGDIVRLQAGAQTKTAVGDGKIVGFAFKDANGDGIYDYKTESRLSNVDVKLIDEDGDVAAMATTNFSGTYRFNDIVYGNYALEFETIDGLGFVAADQGMVEGRDSDVTDTDTGLTDMFEINSPDIARIQAGYEIA